jgi:5-methylcytosine-specific restriction endonuclease McrA
MHASPTESRLAAYPALVLNADFRPLQYLPLSILSWKDALRSAVGGQVDVIAEHDVSVCSPSLSMLLPAILRVRRFVARPTAPPLTRHNLLVLRDKCACAYCGRTFSTNNLTYDHVIPRSQGGRHRWENLVAACSACNGRKADRTPERARMPLLWRPWRPTVEELARAEFFCDQRKIHAIWRDFLPFAA